MVNVTISVGAMRCRCCLAPGAAAKDLSSEYDWMGEREIYADMLLESFDVRLKQIKNAGWAICDTCISRLRDSSNFKKQVLYAEKTLLKSLNITGALSKPDVSSESKLVEVKIEAQKDGDDVDDFDVQYLDEDIDLDEDINDISVKYESATPISDMSNEEDIPLSSLSKSAKQKAPQRIKISHTESIGSISKLRLKAQTQAQAKLKAQLEAQIARKAQQLKNMKTNFRSRTSPGAMKVIMNEMGQVKIVPKTELTNKIGLRMSVPKKTAKMSAKPDAYTSSLKKTTIKPLTNKGGQLLTKEVHMEKLHKNTDSSKVHFSKAALLYSTALPFSVQRRHRVLCCIYNCKTVESLTLSSLRSHMKEEHSNTSNTVKCILKGNSETSLRVDITDLTCNKCGHPVTDLDVLQEHLESVHDIKTFKNNADVLIPYKLGANNVCQICKFAYRDFPTLDDHVEHHFPVAVCEICGLGFRDIKNLKTHNFNVHAEKRYTCKVCDAKFVKDFLLKKHEKNIHEGVGACICHICPNTRFLNHYTKMKHMAEHHGFSLPSSECETCKKTFSTLSALRLHIKEIHGTIQFKCNLCVRSFSTLQKLTSHEKRVHRGARVACIYCRSDSATVYELSKHIQKFHPGRERRHLCSSCGIPCGSRMKLLQHSKENHG